MEKTPPMRMVEAQAGKDIRQVIRDAVERTGSIAAAADELSITRAGLYKWIDRLDGQVLTTSEVSFEGFDSADEREPQKVAA